MDFVVEAGIPFRIEGRGRRSTIQFPLHEMSVGDSFLIPCEPTKKNIDSWRRRLLVAKKGMKGGKWSTAVVSEGLRVWRTE